MCDSFFIVTNLPEKQYIDTFDKEQLKMIRKQLLDYQSNRKKKCFKVGEYYWKIISFIPNGNELPKELHIQSLTTKPDHINSFYRSVIQNDLEVCIGDEFNSDDIFNYRKVYLNEEDSPLVQHFHLLDAYWIYLDDKVLSCLEKCSWMSRYNKEWKKCEKVLEKIEMNQDRVENQEIHFCYIPLY